MNNEDLMFQLLIMNKRAVCAENTLKILQALLKSDKYVSTETITAIIDAALGFEEEANA